MSHRKNLFMRLRNKILVVILGLLLLNLAREYIFVKEVPPPSSGDLPCSINLDVKNKDWTYYSSVFDSKGETIKSVHISLSLALRGTIISNPSNSFAIIEDLTNKSQDLYRLGDMINGAKIVAMNRNEVTLDYGGTKQELFMCEVAPRTYDVRGATSHNSNGVDFAKILTQIRLKPYFEDGKCAGFQINNINEGSIKQMGLQDGDIVKSINGVRVDDPLKAMQMIYSMERNNPVHLGIMRSDEKVELDCRLKDENI